MKIILSDEKGDNYAMSTAELELFERFFIYDRTTGEFYWRVVVWKAKHNAGDKAGTFDNKGYRILRLNKKAYKAHRVAWLLFYKEWPNGIIDHIDRNTANNKIENLRIVSYSQNQANSPLKENAGIYKSLNNYRSTIMHEGIKYDLGTFKTPEEAQLAYLTKRAELKNV